MKCMQRVIRSLFIPQMEKLKTYASTNPYLTFSRKDVKNKGFKCKVAGYITINNKKCYGEWSDLKTIIPGAKITSATMAGRYNVRLKWKKVDKAVKHTIYLRIHLIQSRTGRIANLEPLRETKPAS